MGPRCKYPQAPTVHLTNLEWISKKFITICKCIATMKSVVSENMLMWQRQTMCNLCCLILMNRAPSQTENVITHRSSSAVRLPRFAEVIVSSPSLGSVCMAVTSASLNGEINYHWCHLSWHRSQFDHVNQMIGPLDIPLLCNHALMKRIKRHLGYLTEFIIHHCHGVMWTTIWLTRSHSHSLTLIKVIELRCYMFRWLT